MRALNEEVSLYKKESKSRRAGRGNKMKEERSGECTEGGSEQTV